PLFSICSSARPLQGACMTLCCGCSVVRLLIISLCGCAVDCGSFLLSSASGKPCAGPPVCRSNPAGAGEHLQPAGGKHTALLRALLGWRHEKSFYSSYPCCIVLFIALLRFVDQP